MVLGNSLALYNPPVRVAEEFAMLNVLSGGRLIAGFPLGTAMDTVFITLREKYQEAHDLVMRAWKEREPFSFNGKSTSFVMSKFGPGPTSKVTHCQGYCWHNHSVSSIDSMLA